MWKPMGNKIVAERLGLLEPEEVLYEFDEEPLTFIARDPEGGLLLLHNVMVLDRVARYLISAVDARILNDLKLGWIDTLTALRQPRCWVADVVEEGSVKTLWRVEFSTIPENILPRPGAMVNPDHDPLFRIRLIGSGVGPGKTSAGNVRMAVQATELGLRGLARIALDEKKKVGQVPRDVRHFSDLPYLFSRAASFEVVFGRPRDRLPGIDDEIFHEMGNLLERGLAALRSDEAVENHLEGLSEEQTLQLFEAIRALTPPLRGDIERVQVGGTLTDHISGSRILTGDDRRRSSHWIKAAKGAPPKEAPFRVAGVMEEADVGLSRFTLRQLDHLSATGMSAMAEIAFRFEDRLSDAVSDAWNSQDRIFVVGERVDAEYRALSIEVAAETTVDVPGSE